MKRLGFLYTKLNRLEEATTVLRKCLDILNEVKDSVRNMEIGLEGTAITNGHNSYKVNCYSSVGKFVWLSNGKETFC